MVLTEEQRKEKRREGMAAKSKAERIGMMFTSGRPPVEELRTPTEAVKAASVLLFGLQGTMSDPKFGLDAKDCQVHVCFVDTAFTGAFTMPLVPDKEAELIQYLEKHQVLMLGLLFTVKDLEKGGDVVGVRPFLVTPRTMSWLSDLKERAALGH
jgi:hypothetical protein